MSLYGNMSLYAFPTVCGQTLRALSRYPSRTAFSWPGGSLSYQGAIDLIGRMQSVFTRLALAPGSRVAFLTANRADTWCAGVSVLDMKQISVRFESQPMTSGLAQAAPRKLSFARLPASSKATNLP